MTTQPLPVSKNHEIENLRELFRKRHRGRGVKCRLPFDDLRERFCVRQQSIATVARAAGVTVQAMRLTYNNYIKPLCGDESGMDRYKRISREKVFLLFSSTRVRRVRNEGLRLIAKRAQAKGHRVEPSFSGSRLTIGYVRAKRIVISGELCSIAIVRKGFVSTTGMPYARIERGHFPTMHLIVVVTVEGYHRRYYVIPTALLTAGKTMYVPLRKKRSRCGPKAFIEWQKYEDAWSLLGKTG